MNRLLARLRAWFDPRYARRRLAHNFWLKVSSTVFAVGLWAFVNLGATETEKGLFVPLEWQNLPDGFTITSTLPESVSVRVRGPRTILGSIEERGEKIVLDLRNVRPGATAFKIDPELLTLPRGVRVTGMSPVEVTLDVERLAAKSLPVAVNLAAGVPVGYRLVESEVRPATVQVRGPASKVEALKSVPTGPIRLEAATGGFEQSVVVERPAELVQLSPDRVVVRGRLEELLVSAEYHEIEVGVRNARGSARLKPRLADVVVRGPQRLLKDFKPSGQNVYVDAAGLVRGTRQERVAVELPEGLAASEVRPALVTLQVLAEPPSHRAR